MAKQRIHGDAVGERRDGCAVAIRSVVERVGGGEPRRRGHVLRYDGRHAGQMLAEVAGEYARIGVVAAAGPARDQHGDRPALVECFHRLREGRRRQRKEGATGRRRKRGARRDDSL